MAATDKNMTFDVNLLPATTGDHNLGSSDKKWNLYVDKINGDTPSFKNPNALTINNTTYDGSETLNAGSAIRYVAGTGTAAVTSSPYTFAKWDASISSVTAYYDGLTIAYKIAVAGNGSYGTCLQINSLGYHPVVVHTNSMVSTRYGVGATILLMYQSAISGTVYNNSASSSTISGCWVVLNDYDSGNTTSSLKTENGRIYAGSTGIKPYSIIALDTTGAWSTLIASNSTTGTGTGKTINKSGSYAIPPEFLWYNANNTTAANSLVASSYATYEAYHAVDVRYSTNYSSFTTNKPVYLECTITNGYWSPTDNCLTQTLTSGKYYILMGIAYSTAYQLSLFPYHPVYYYNGSQLIDYNAPKTITNITRSGTTFTATRNDGTEFTFTQQDNNTTYTFAGGTNGFLVTPSSGTAQTVAVTPNIANNITGSGTDGYLAKFNGTNTITKGPQLGSSDTTFLRNDGTWTALVTGIKGNSESTYRTGQVNLTAANIGLGNVTNHAQVTAVTWDSTNKKITRTIGTTAADVVQFSAGDNITLTGESGKLTIAATDNPGYGKITPTNNPSTVTALDSSNTTAVQASSYSEELKFTAANKWVVLAGANSGTAGSDELKIAHFVPSSITNAGPTNNQTPSYGSTFDIPVVSIDAAGHVTAINTTTVTIPASDNTNAETQLYVNATAGGAYSNAATTNTSTYVHLYDHLGSTYTKRNTLQLTGSGSTTVTANNNGVITINSIDTDTKVTQSPSTDSTWKKVLLSTDATVSPSTEMGIKTNTTDFCNKITSQPSTGTLRAEIFRIRQYMELQWNDTDESLDFVFI